MFNELQPRHGHHFSAGDTVFIINHGRFHTSMTGPTTITTLRQGAHGTPVLTCGSSEFFQDTHRGVDNSDMFLLPEGDPALDLVPQITQMRQVVNQIHHRASAMISNPSDENLGSLVESARELIEHNGHNQTLPQRDTEPAQDAPATEIPVLESSVLEPVAAELTQPSEPAPQDPPVPQSAVVELTAAAPSASPGPSAPSAPTKTKHGLTADGKPHDENGQILTTRGAGRGLCSCGVLSEVLPTREARRKWMIQHKRESSLQAAA